MSYNSIEGKDFNGSVQVRDLSRGTLARTPGGRLFIRTRDGITFLGDGLTNPLDASTLRVADKPCFPLKEGEQVTITVRRRFITERNQSSLDEAGD